MKINLLGILFFLSLQGFSQTLPPPPSSAGKPKINGAKILGMRSGSSFHYTIPILGERPMELTVSGLPNGLKLYSSTGSISGKVSKKGDYNVVISAKNGKGKAEETIKIIIGDQIALTPPMGWDGSSYFKNMDQSKLKLIEDAMLKYDLVNHGYNYIIIPDSWQGNRGGKHNGIMADSTIYPEFKKSIDQLHKSGFKVGVYSTPWVTSPTNKIGSSADSADGFTISKTNVSENYRVGKYHFYKQDSKQWSDYGIDLLKFEWNPADIRHARIMSEDLKKTRKDILFYVSGNGSYDQASEWQRVANVWKTSTDYSMSWDSLKKVSIAQEQWSPYTGPGHWPLPGKINLGSANSDLTYANKLNKYEQMTQFTLWSLLSAPLFLDSDLSNLDNFTLSLITNDEVIAIDQDAQGIQARKVFAKDSLEVLAKSLQDGSLAIGLFNKGNVSTKMNVTWKDLGITGSRLVRDVWMQQDLGKFKDSYETEVPPHGVVLVRILKH